MTDRVLDLLLASLATSAIVHVWMHGSIFGPVRQRLLTYTNDQRKPAILRTVAFGPTCQYCFTHWVGAAVTIAVMREWAVALLAVFPVIWLSNYSLLIHWLLSVVVPQYLNARVSLQMHQNDMESQAQMRRAS